MKIWGWLVVVGFALLIIVTGCLALLSAPTYDERAHRAEITKIYPSVDWPEYQDAAREICGLNDRKFGYVHSLATSESIEAAQAMTINTSYLCPNRLDSLKK